MKERLIELILNAPKTDTVYGNIKLDKPIQTAQTIADHLLANGVIVPPCKVGDTVYSIEKGISQVFCGRIYEIVIRGDAVIFRATRQGYYSLAFDKDKIGKTVFLTREEAEKALEGRKV